MDFFKRSRPHTLFVVLFLMVGSAYLFYNHLSDGFSVCGITSRLQSNPAYAIGEITLERKEALSKILDQPFRYLDKGCQSYVFASEDGKYVIKFFRHEDLCPLDWMRKIPMPLFLRECVEKKIARREMKTRYLFSGPLLAYHVMPAETGLIHIHLTRTPECGKRLSLIDKIGFKHEIDLDDYQYILQKRTISLKETFSQSLKRGGENEVKKRIQELASLISTACKLRVHDADHAFERNVGFAVDGSGPIFMDVGMFYEDESLDCPKVVFQEVLYRLSRLRRWCVLNDPAFISLVDEVMASHALFEDKVE